VTVHAGVVHRWAIVAVAGELDLVTAPDLQAQLDRLIAVEGQLRVALDDPNR
jgi:hypothetical protein